VACRLKDIPAEEIENITPFPLAPWVKRVQTISNVTQTSTTAGWSVIAAVSSSARNGMVGVGGVSQLPISARGKSKREVFSFTLGPRTEKNLYSGQLAAMAYALRSLPTIADRNVAVITSHKAVVMSLGNPRQQSGQVYMRLIYEAIEKLRERGNRVAIEWIPVSDENELVMVAKTDAREATKDGATPRRQFPRMRSTTLNIQKQKLKTERCIPEKVGKHAKRIDAALPGNHTRLLYDELPWTERSVLAQLRTGMSALNNYL
jgi:ribonuclease HI